MSYSPTIAIGVFVLSTTNRPPPRMAANVYVLLDSMIGQIGALSGRSSGDWHGRPFGVTQLARSSVNSKPAPTSSRAGGRPAAAVAADGPNHFHPFVPRRHRQIEPDGQRRRMPGARRTPCGGGGHRHPVAG
jgi:hypothetical protein